MTDGLVSGICCFAGEMVEESLYRVDMLWADGLLIMIHEQCNLYVYFGNPCRMG